jgi:sterol desaturase/sphingolipid hydroxylase (fatty acid hydroxylase superfamily)
MLLIFAGVAGTFLAAEILFPARPLQPFFRPGVFADLLYVPLHVVLRMLLNISLAGLIMTAGRALLPAGAVAVLSDRPVWLQAAVLIFVLDFFFYVMHRAKHRWTWWWRLHETHHSSRHLDWLASARFHPLEKLLDRAIFLLPLLVLGVSEKAIVIWASVDVFFGVMNHSNTRLRIGPLRYLFVGPGMHSWHHAIETSGGGCNFGNNLSIFDWIFGTAYWPGRRNDSFGIAVPDYPAGNLVRQFLFAFRRTPVSGDQAASARSSEAATSSTAASGIPG